MMNFCKENIGNGSGVEREAKSGKGSLHRLRVTSIAKSIHRKHLILIHQRIIRLLCKRKNCIALSICLPLLFSKLQCLCPQNHDRRFAVLIQIFQILLKQLKSVGIQITPGSISIIYETAGISPYSITCFLFKPLS